MQYIPFIYSEKHGGFMLSCYSRENFSLTVNRCLQNAEKFCD